MKNKPKILIKLIIGNEEREIRIPINVYELWKYGWESGDARSKISLPDWLSIIFTTYIKLVEPAADMFVKGIKARQGKNIS